MCMAMGVWMIVALIFHSAEVRRSEASNASPWLEVIAKTVGTRSTCFRAERTHWAHAVAKHMRQDEACLHLERLHDRMGIRSLHCMSSVIPRNINNNAFGICPLP